jgi:eukaryotic-like serine/threonine-protein kinase
VSSREATTRTRSPQQPVPFGQYELCGLIGCGGMAEVHRARRRSPGSVELLAIKRMHARLERESRFREMFVREGTLALMLHHEAIVRTLEVGYAEGRPYIAMEYIDGQDLAQVLRRCQETGTRIPVPHAVYVAAMVARGLHYAHSFVDGEGRPLTLVNRDVSPANIRVGYDGAVKLLDFGIARTMLKAESEIGELKGKLSYMSPEQIRGLPLDARSDIFSLGIVLHELLTTHKLFRGDTDFTLMERVRSAEVTPPSKLNPRVPEALDAAVMRALCRDPNGRYQTAADLAADLCALLEGYRFRLTELCELLARLFAEERRSMAPPPPPGAAPSPAPPARGPQVSLWRRLRSKLRRR